MSQPHAPRPSFLQEEESTPLLFSPEELGLEYIEDNDGAMRSGQYSAERLWKKRPEVYREIVNLLAGKTFIRAIKRQCKVHHRTIEAIADREGQTIDTLRLSLGQRALKNASLTLESIEDDVANNRLKPGEKAFVFATLVDKGQLLTGGATSRPEVNKAGDVAKDLSDLLDSMPVADAHVVPETHSQPGEKIALAAPVPGLPDRAPTPLAMDSESVPALCKSGDVTAFDAATPSETGGEGVRENSPPPPNMDA